MADNGRPRLWLAHVETRPASLDQDRVHATRTKRDPHALAKPDDPADHYLASTQTRSSPRLRSPPSRRRLSSHSAYNQESASRRPCPMKDSPECKKLAFSGPGVPQRPSGRSSSSLRGGCRYRRYTLPADPLCFIGGSGVPLDTPVAVTR